MTVTASESSGHAAEAGAMSSADAATAAFG
jgi:hypothetical protein